MSMTDYSIITKFRNKDQCEWLIHELEARGKSCYNFCTTPVDPENPGATPEEQMRVFESDKDFYTKPHHRHIFEKDLQGLKNAKTVILLLPAGTSAHIEAGIAFGLGKPVFLIGKPEKSESLYFIFSERYDTPQDFLKTIS